MESGLKEHGMPPMRRWWIMIYILTSIGVIRGKDGCLPGSEECRKNTLRVCDISKKWVDIPCPGNTRCLVNNNGTVACSTLGQGKVRNEEGSDRRREKKRRKPGRKSKNTSDGGSDEASEINKLYNRENLEDEESEEELDYDEQETENPPQERADFRHADEKTGAYGRRSPEEPYVMSSPWSSARSKRESVKTIIMTKEVRAPPMEMKLEYTLPGAPPVVKTLNSSDGKMFSPVPEQRGVSGGSSVSGGSPSSSSGSGGSPSSSSGSGGSPSSSSGSSGSPSSSSGSSGSPSSSSGSSGSPSSSSGSGASSPRTPSGGSSPSGSSGSQSSSDQGSSGAGAISKEDLMAVMKQFQFQPNEKYLDAVVSGIGKEKDKDMAAMFLAQMAHETEGFKYIEEIACSKDGGCPGQYGTGAPGKSYHGRGFIQLSWPDNYKKAGEALGMGDQLYQNPEKVAQDPKLGFDVSWWYWDKVVRPAMGGAKEFGKSTKAINGALECGGGSNPKAERRYNIYKAICEKMKLTPAPNTGC